jgi:hypothetical protein
MFFNVSCWVFGGGLCEKVFFAINEDNAIKQAIRYFAKQFDEYEFSVWPITVSKVAVYER